MLTVPVLAGAQSVSCPLLLNEGAVEVPRPPPGWVGSSPGQARLTGGGVMSGHPKLMNYLKPADVKKVKAGSITTWLFTAGEERWLYCAYGSTSIQIAKRLDDAGTECSLVVKDDRWGGIAEMTAVCKR
jgi:hypothetical protein